MRVSLSCDRCRTSKVKCIHPGIPPCARCKKSGVRDCFLTEPHTKSGTQDVRITGQRTRTPAALLRSRVARARRVTGRSDAQPSRQLRTSTHQVLDPPKESCNENQLLQLPDGIILKALNIFTNKFPELSILHVTFFMDYSRKTRIKESTALLAAALGVVRMQCSEFDESWTSKLRDPETYIMYAESTLTQFILDAPKIEVVQTLLIITLYNWGNRHFHKAWIYCGMAIRIMQALCSSGNAPFPNESGQTLDPRRSIARAVETMNYWSCFVLERMVSSGTYNPPMLPISEMMNMHVKHPLSATEFAFGVEKGTIFQGFINSVGDCDSSTPGTVLDITRSFEIIVAGFEIWSQIMKFVAHDGRGAPGMCAQANCPWTPGSPWSSSMNQLEHWRARQHPRLNYPNNRVALHMTLGYAESFTYLNLLYYSSLIMLHREYFPFLPTQDTLPCGPVDPPLLEAEAPHGWWEQSAQQLFNASEQIARLLNEASECGANLSTPFVGYCAFLACHFNLYISIFPRMNLNRTSEPEKLTDFCLDYLRDFQHKWKLGEAWIKTLQNLSVLYRRAVTNRQKYQGATRYNFNILHQSIHEFRAVDRSARQIQEMENMETANQAPISAQKIQDRSLEPGHVDADNSLCHLLAGFGTQADEQSLWPQWWSNLEDIDFEDFENMATTLFLEQDQADSAYDK